MIESEQGQPRAWLCKHCNERVDPTMELCWKCGRDRAGERVIDFAEEKTNPFLSCPQCGYDLRGNLEAENCPECGTELKLSDAQRELYWVPSATKTGAITKLFRNPLRMIPIAIFAWLLVGVLYLADEETPVIPSYRVSDFGEYLALFVFTAALFFTFAVIGGIMVQGLQPADEEQTEPSISSGNGFILRWMTRCWGKYLFWVAWILLLLSYLLY